VLAWGGHRDPCRSFSESHANTAAIFSDELDAGLFERGDDLLAAF
jgi:hypothetical protein